MGVRHLIVASFLAFAAVGALWLASARAAEKVNICHSGNGKHFVTIVVDDDSNQIQGHCNHAFDCRGVFSPRAIELCSTMPPCAGGSCPASPASH